MLLLLLEEFESAVVCGLCEDTPFTLTVTVSTLPAPLGPSMTRVLSVRRSPTKPALLAFAFDNPPGLLLPFAVIWFWLLLSQGISVNSAPPMKSISLNAPSSPELSSLPFNKGPFVVAVVGGARVGSGKIEAGLATETIRSRARR